MITEPTKKQVQEVKDRELKRLSQINSQNFQDIYEARNYTNSKVEYILAGSTLWYKKIEKKLTDTYKNLFNRTRDELVNSYNLSNKETMYLSESALGSTIKWNKQRVYKQLPRTQEFNVTNRILNEKAISVRSKKMAKEITTLIEQSNKKGYSVEKTTKLLDIKFGYRNKDGKINRKALKLLKAGRISHTNGHFYTTYRIARTESMRMSSISNNLLADELRLKGYDNRLKMLSKIDSRTREQSIEMNGDISTPNFTFKYPNGQFYKHGLAPAKYSINDRETTHTVFANNDKENSRLYTDFNDFNSSIENRNVFIDKV